MELVVLVGAVQSGLFAALLFFKKNRMLADLLLFTALILTSGLLFSLPLLPCWRIGGIPNIV